MLNLLLAVRQRSESLVAPLEPEDLCLQGMADASPPKWHLAHTTWFFDTFLLQPYLKGYEGCDPRWSYQFNSYYEAAGARHPRPSRGVLTRPTIREVLEWRQRVDAALTQLLTSPNADQEEIQQLAELGLHHEQQHQELLLMDLLDGFSRQPLEPAYQTGADHHLGPLEPTQARWISCDGGLYEIGHAGAGFHFDNEGPSHRIWLEAFALMDHLVCNDDFRGFIADGGYQRPELWMSEGWAVQQQLGWQAPRYWRGDGPADQWQEEFTLEGRRHLNRKAPVRHLSWFEADAYARWCGARLPSEAEWEVALQQHQPLIHDAHGTLWQWTASPYRPYPGFLPAPGAVGEYNGKFMSSQFVLRGSSWLTPEGHERDTYRNFFAPANRWMAAGLRLAR